LEFSSACAEGFNSAVVNTITTVDLNILVIFLAVISIINTHIKNIEILRRINSSYKMTLVILLSVCVSSDITDCP